LRGKGLYLQCVEILKKEKSKLINPKIPENLPFMIHVITQEAAD